MSVKISGFMWAHNLVESGYPAIEAISTIAPYIDEMVVVDMKSTDETRKVLEYIKAKVVDGDWWPGRSEDCLTQCGFNHYTTCKYDTIWALEADEVYDSALAAHIRNLIQKGIPDIVVPRVQVEQNFQRIRWYPGSPLDRVHRIFKKGTVTRSGHTTVEHLQHLRPMHETPIESGFVWDCANCFRDNWLQRVKNQAELWDETPQYRIVPDHFTQQPTKLQTDEEMRGFLSLPHWEWKRTPLDVPYLLTDLVGQTQYDPWPLAELLRGEQYEWQM